MEKGKGDEVFISFFVFVYLPTFFRFLISVTVWQMIRAKTAMLRISPSVWTREYSSLYLISIEKFPNAEKRIPMHETAIISTGHIICFLFLIKKKNAATAPQIPGSKEKAENPMIFSKSPGWIFDNVIWENRTTKALEFAMQLDRKNAPITAPILLGDREPFIALISPYVKMIILSTVAISARIFPLKLSGVMLCVRSASMNGKVSARSVTA